MSRCDQECEQGRSCPSRKVKPYPSVPEDLPVQYADDEPPDFVDVAIAIVIVSIIFVVVAMAWRHYL